MIFYPRSRTFVTLGRLFGLLLTAGLGFHSAWATQERTPLRIYLEDNHAGSFQFLASTLDLDRPHVLVLIDAHPDSDTPADVALLRRDLRRVASPGQLGERLVSWRRTGRIQAFDWIAPLMPTPLAQVIWIPPPFLSHRNGSVGSQADAVAPSDSLRSGFSSATLENLETRLPAGLPVVASIDLDSFAGLTTVERKKSFEAVWHTVIRLPRLTAISFAVSRPWLTDDAEASALVMLAVKVSLSVANVELRFEPYGIEGPDRSTKAGEYYRRRQEPPRFDIDRVQPELRSLLLANADRVHVQLDSGRWNETLNRWRAKTSAWRIEVEGIDAGADGVFRPCSETEPALHLVGGPPATIRQVTWLAWTPTQWTYNILPELASGKAFTSAAPPVVDYQATVIATTESLTLDASVWRRALPGPDHAGVLRVSAEFVSDGGVEHAARAEIRQSLGDGFRGGLSEQFGLPYVFGAGFLRREDLHGPDTGVGNDCANFLVYAWRRSGLKLPWCNPAQLRRHLVCLGKGIQASDAISLPRDVVERGAVIHLGSHVAAVWRDEEPIGVLGPNDLVIHHLGGAPEVLTLQSLLSQRSARTFDLYAAPPRDAVVWIGVGGDVMPGDFGAPGEALRRGLVQADLVVANLETTVGAVGSPVPKKYSFTISSQRLSDIQSLGIRGLSLANNHSGDFGTVGLGTTLDELLTHDLGSFGAGPDIDRAARAWTTHVKDLTIAFLGVIISDPSDGGTPDSTRTFSVSTLPKDELAIADAITAARREADCVVVVPHWGTEGQRAITDEQRRWARWLVQHGADAVVGSGPHQIQFHETIEGAPVFYSTGNLWFAGQWPISSRAAGVAFLGLDGRGRIIQSRFETFQESNETRIDDATVHPRSSGSRIVRASVP